MNDVISTCRSLSHISLRISALCPMQEIDNGPFPWVAPFSPRTPLPGYRFCSSASPILWDHLTSHERACRLYRPRRFPAVPTGHNPLEARGFSRFSRLECPRMLSVYDSAAPTHPSPFAVWAVLPSPGQNRIGTRKLVISELNGWPALPLADATPATLPSPAYGSRPEQLARSSL